TCGKCGKFHIPASIDCEKGANMDKTTPRPIYMDERYLEDCERWAVEGLRSDATHNLTNGIRKLVNEREAILASHKNLIEACNKAASIIRQHEKLDAKLVEAHNILDMTATRASEIGK